MPIYIRPFEADDLDTFVPIEPFEKDGFDSKLAQTVESSGFAVTGVRNGRVVGCGGVHPNGEQGELWLRLSAECLEHKIDTLRCLIDGLKIVEEIFPFKQLNAIIKCSFDRSIKLIEFLGFKRTQKKDNKWFIYSKLVKE